MVDAADLEADAMPAQLFESMMGGLSAAEGAKLCIAHVRLRRGWFQGCALAQPGSVFPYMVSLHKTCKENKGFRVACSSDDTIAGGARGTVYRDFDRLRDNTKEDCDNESNEGKLTAFCARGGTAGIPAAILKAQGGEVFGCTLVGVPVAARTVAGTQYVIETLKEELTKRLAPIKEVVKMRDTDRTTDTKQIQYQYLSRCANELVGYWQRAVRPSIAEPVMLEAVEPVLREAHEAIAEAHASAPEWADQFWSEAAMPTKMGGDSVGGSDYRCLPMYVAAKLKRLPTVLRVCPALHGKSMLEVWNSKLYKDARKGYETLEIVRAEVEERYAKIKEETYISNRGGTVHGFVPAGLPNQLPAPAAMLNPDKSSTIHPPRSRALARIMHHQRWLKNHDWCEAEDMKRRGALPHEQMIRFISISQEGADALLVMAPDGSYGTTVASADFEFALQSRHGLAIAAAATLHDQEEAMGKKVDRRGSDLTNAGEYNRRHHGVVKAGYNMVSAAAVGKVVLGDKENPSLTDMINEDHVVDLAEIGGNDATGADVCWE